MAKFIIEVLNLDGTKHLEAVTVTMNWDFFGSPQSREAITDSNGLVKFELNIINTTIQVTAAKDGFIDKETVFVDWIGTPHPDKVTMNLAFKPFEQGKDTLENIAREGQKHLGTIVIVGAIVGTLVVVTYLIGKAKSGDLSIPKIPNLREDKKFPTFERDKVAKFK